MNRQHIKALVLLALVAGVLFYWLQSGEEGSSSTHQTTDTKDSSKPFLSKTPSSSKQVQSQLSGIVLDKTTLAPLPGARLSLSRRRLDNGFIGTAGKPPSPLIQQSQSDGSFTFPSLAPGAYSVSVAIPGYKPLSIDTIRLRRGEKNVDVRILLSTGGHRLFGTVTDVGGGPVSFALVRAKDFSSFQVSSLFRAPFTAMTNEEGEYELYLGNGRYQVDVFHEDYRGEKKRLAIGGQDLESNFVLTPGSAIDGKVLRSSDDSPVEGAMVTWVGMGKTRGFTLSGIALNGSAITDAEGRFSLRGLGNGSFEIRALSRNTSTTQPTIVELSIAETASDVVVYVDEAFTISGHVVDKNDENAMESGVIVGAYNLSPGALFASNNPSDEKGYFEIQGVQPGSYTVGAAAEERLPNFFGEGVTVVDKDIEGLLITVDKGHTISGRISPPQEAQLALQIDMKEIGFSSVLSAASSALVNGRSDAEGYFTLHGVGSGTFTLVANAANGNEGKLEIEVQDDLSDLLIQIEDRASITGIVTDSDGKPVSGARIQVKSTKNSSIRSFTANNLGNVTLTGSDGRFSHQGLKDGGYDLTVHTQFQLQWAHVPGSPGKEAKKKQRFTPLFFEVSDQQSPAPFELVVVAHNHWITGVVRDSDGAIVPDAWVTARWTEDEAIDTGRPNRRQRERPVLTDEQGEFRLIGLRAGSYTLWVEARSGSAKGKGESVPVDTQAEIVVEALGNLEGAVQLGNTPIGDYMLNVHGPTKRRVRVQNSEGAYTLKGLEAGSYSISVSSNEGVSNGKVEIRSGKTSTQNFALSTFGSIRGILVDSVTGEPIVGMAAIAHVGKDRNQWAASAMTILDGSGPTTDEEGRFRVEGLNTGEGILLILDPNAKGFTPLVQTAFTLKVGENLDLETVEVEAPSSEEKAAPAE